MPREAPPRNTIYTGMLAVTLGAMVLACVVVALHLNAYDWTMEVKGGPPISLPQKTAPAVQVPGGGGQAALPAQANTQAVASTTPAEIRPSTVPPPQSIPASPLAVAPQPTPTVAEKPTEATQPISTPPAKPTGIVPSPFRLPGDR